MTEAELEDDGIVPELVPENQLQVLVKDLEPTKGQFFIEKFSDHVKMAAEWAKKAKNIIVTDENQSVLMSQARIARLFLRDKRLEIENTRKILKADALKEGQAIDKISNFLKDLITPTELHLERQEKFVEFREKAEKERIQIEVEKKFAADQLAKEQQEADRRVALEAENERLREAAKVKEEIAEKFRIEQEAILQEERNKTLRIERELQIRKQEELKKEADKIRAEEALLKGSDIDKMICFRNAVQAIQFPDVKSVINKRIIETAKSYLYLAIKDIKIQEEE